MHLWNIEKKPDKIIRKFYYFTIANITAVVSIILGIYFFTKTEPSNGWNFIFACGFLVYSLLIIIVDQVLQYITNKYWIITLIEIVIITFIYCQVIY